MDSPTHLDALAPYGWTEAVANRYTRLGLTDAEPGRVTRSDRGRAEVVTRHGQTSAAWSGSIPITGDWVAVADGAISIVLDRTSAIVRGNAAESGDQILAVNVDRAFLVMALDTRLSLNRLERALTLIWGGDAEPVVVLNKADAADSSLIEHTRQRAAISASDAEIIVTSAVDGRGMDRMHALAGDGATVVLLGASGVGKSTIANRLIGSDLLDTGSTRHGDSKGRHTTVTREMVPTMSGGVLIDTPGLRGLGLASQGNGVALAFSDIETLAADCRFRDCSHDTEPGCAVRDVVAERRLVSYRKLRREQSTEERRAEIRARRTARRSRRKYDRTRGW